jgi:hypothetical protein
LQEGKSIKFGIGCVERITPLQPGLGFCLISSFTARVWCPNGKVFERNGALPLCPLSGQPAG